MGLAVLYSRALSGMDAPLVTVEVHLANGLPSFQIVGLPEAEVKESKDRVRAALQTSRFEFPARRITVNLAPADLPKVQNVLLFENDCRNSRINNDKCEWKQHG